MYIYLLYSEQQATELKKIESSMSLKFTPGEVIINGRRKKFTEKSTKKTNRYPDCKIVAEGEESTLRYTLPSSVK